MKHEKSISTISDVAQSIEDLVCDDELLAKITLNFLAQLNESIDTNNTKYQISGSHILRTCWPYANNPPDESELVTAPMAYQKKEMKLSASNTFETKVLTILQKHLNKRVSVSNLLDFAFAAAKVTGIPLKRKFTHSKQRIIQWLFENWEHVEPHVEEAIALSCEPKREKE